jgi:hypothetical protein
MFLQGASRVALLAIVAVIWSMCVAVTSASASTAPKKHHTRTGALPRGDLLIPNHSFENGIADWTLTCPEATRTTDDQRSDGEHALKLTGDAACPAPRAYSALVTTSAREKHTAFVRVLAQSGRATARLAFYDAAKKIVGRSPTAVTSARGWTTLKPTTTAPATARYVSVQIGAADGGTVFADNALISRQFTDVGPRIFHDGYVRTATFGTDKAGRVMAYVVTDGSASSPARLNVIDVADGRLIRSLALNKGAPSGSWAAVTGATGTIYVASFEPGILWAYHPGATSMIKVTTMRGTHVPFALAPDATGGVYFGGYPSGVVYHYQSGKGVKAFVSAKKLTGQNYVRSLAVDPTTRTVYVGVGARAAVLACDESTAKCTNILPGAFRGQQFGYQLAAAPGKAFVYLSPSNELLVLNVAKQPDRSYKLTIAATIPNVSYPGASDPVDGIVYYRGAGGSLYGYDVASDAITTVAPKLPASRGWGSGTLPDVPGKTILSASIAPGGVDITRFSVQTGTLTTKRVTGLIGAPVSIQSIQRGPDGAIYTGGHLVGGLSSYMPMRSDRSAQIPGVGQPEGMTAVGDTLYLGIYPGARIQAYRPDAPAKAGENPATVCSLAPQGQDRPYAMVAGGGKVFIGTMAGYGGLQGALTMYDPATGTCTVKKNLARDQSVVSLAFANDVVYAGTLAWGGFGAQPTQVRARLITWNLRTGRTTSTPVPVRAASLEGLVVGPGGNIWMMAQNWLLVYSPKSGKFVYKRQLFPELTYPGQRLSSTHRISPYDAFLAVGADGKVYGTLRGRFFRLDSHKAAPTVLYRGGVVGLTKDAYGNLYFVRGAEDLVRYVP